MYSEFYNFICKLNHPSYEIDGKHFQWPLDVMRTFDSFLGSPSKRLNVIHITGTNGKGSCSNFIASALTAAGYKVGVYGSPQLLDLNERIKINGLFIDDEHVKSFYKKLLDFISMSGSTNVFHSYSEVLVEMAFDYFVSQNVDVAVIEVGIGGLLDPTNIIKSPLVSVVTSIGLDHFELFGNSLENIAKAKSGIIKRNCPVVIGHIPDELRYIFEEKSVETNSELFFADDLFPYVTDDCHIEHDDYFDLQGPYQPQNLKTVSCVMHILKKKHNKMFSKLNKENMLYGMKNTVQISNFHGRWEIVCHKPLIILDICSNAFGLEININRLIEMFQSKNYGRLVFILGLSSINHITVKKFLPSWATYYYTEAFSFLSAEDLSKAIQIPGRVCRTVREALVQYLRDSKTSDLVYVGGHIWVVSEALKNISLFYDGEFAHA